MIIKLTAALSATWKQNWRDTAQCFNVDSQAWRRVAASPFRSQTEDWARESIRAKRILKLLAEKKMVRGIKEVGQLTDEENTLVDVTIWKTAPGNLGSDAHEPEHILNLEQTDKKISRYLGLS